VREVEAFFGTTRLTIQVLSHAGSGGASPVPFVAQAFGEGHTPIVEQGNVVEFAASSEELALERMVGYLEGRFGPVR
jgi:hypothetical protein